MKRLLSVFVIAALMLFVVSCNDSGGGGGVNPSTPTVSSYLVVEGGNYVNSALPESTTEEEPHVAMNNTVIPGGSLYATVAYSVEASKILVGVEGTNGHYEIVPENRGMNEITYDFIMVINQELTDNTFFITVGIMDENGEISEYVSVPIQLQVVGTGSLQVSLSFNNDKDVDLHLIEPNGYHIYYGDRMSENGGTLDLDSNPSCDIDHINNENITYGQDAYVQPGEYTVYVDMWANCDPSVATSFVVTVLYGGQPLIAPIAGTFPINEPSNGGDIDNIQPVCHFVVPNNGQQPPAKSVKKDLPKFLRSAEK